MPLAHPLQRRQDVQSSSESPSPSPSPYPSSTSYSNNINNNNNNNNNNNPLFNKFASSPSQPPPALDLNYSFSSNDCYYIDSRQSTPSEHYTFTVADTQYMQNDSSQYLQLRLQQSASNGLPSATTPPPMIEDFSQQSWNNTYPDNAYLAPSPQHQYNPSLTYRTHKRISSDSSAASVGPDSPYTQTTSYPRIVDPDVQSINSAHLESWEHPSSSIGQYPKSVFAQASNSDLFYNPAFQNFNPVSNDAISMMSTQSAMGQIMNQQHGSNNMNGAQNTSRRTFGGGVDPSSDIRSSTPQLDRTMSDVYQDELYNPEMAQSAPSSQPRQQSQGNIGSSHRSAFSDLLQVANTGHLTARSASPAVNVSRQRSPFRESSQFAVEGYSNPSSPAGATRLTSAAQLRQQQKLEADAHAYAQHHPPSRHEYMNPPKTISPKEALLDYDNTDDDAKTPLFPQIKHEPRFPSQNPIRGLHRGNTDESSNNDQSYSSMADSRRDSSSSSAPHPSAPGFSNMPPSVPAIPQQYPFISESRRQSSSLRSGSDQVPEFPASLTSMESTKSETGPPEKVKIVPEADLSSAPSSQEAPVSRPANTTASSGTYTCTTPDCHARFDAAAKLQKHRREAHRAPSQYASTPTTPTSATHNAQAAANNVSRNNAPGPHKCEKINPQTGKPCNTAFSRSYDLTRHEDTIHNNRKQKVRCHLCTEEKTFSRNDALTRHMRVVHPDVDFPGKSRRGRNEGVDVVRQRIETGRGGR